MTRGLLLLPGLLLAGVLALGATTGWAGPPEDELPPCEWFIDLAENYPELEIIACEGEWDDEPRWEGHGLLSWAGRTAAFHGLVGDWYADPGLEYWFEWSMGQGWGEVCGAVPAWLDEERERRPETRHLPRYDRVTLCSVQGVAFNAGEYHPGPTPGVFWLAGGLLHEREGAGTASFQTTLFHDLRVESFQVQNMDGESLYSWPTGKYTPPIPPDTTPGPADPGSKAGGDFPCEKLAELVENYPRLSVVGCGGFPWGHHGDWRMYGLLGWGPGHSGFDGYVRSEASARTSNSSAWIGGTIYLPEVCSSLVGWLEDEHGLVYSCGTHTLEFAFNASYESRDTDLRFHLEGLLHTEDSLAYYEAQFRHDLGRPDLALQGVTIWGMEVEPLFTYYAPRDVYVSIEVRLVEPGVPEGDGPLLFDYSATPAPADAGTGLAPPGLFIPEIALKVR